MPDPFYASPYRHGYEHPDLDLVLSDALALREYRSQNREHRTGTDVLRGITHRCDLTPGHVERIVATLTEPDRDLLVRAALLTNPALEDMALDDLITVHVLPLLALHPSAHRYTDRVLTVLGAARDDYPDLTAQMALTFSPALIEDYFAREIASADERRCWEVVNHPMLTNAGFALMCDLIEDPDQFDPMFATTLFQGLSERADLTREQALRLYEMGRGLGRRNKERGQWVLTPLLSNSSAPVEAMIAATRHPARSIREFVLTQRHVTVPVIVEALRAHTPYAAIRLAHAADRSPVETVTLPEDALTTALDDLDAGVAARGYRMRPAQIRKTRTALLLFAPCPLVWERVLGTCQPANADTEDGLGPFTVEDFFDLCAHEGRRIGSAPRLPVTKHEDFLTWASGHPNARLRALTVARLRFLSQVAAAAEDRSALVRQQAAAHRLVSQDVLFRLSEDPSPRVRAVVAERLLEALA